MAVPTTLAAVLAFAAAVAVAAAVAGDRGLDMVLIHANDMHSRFDETDVHCNECREDDAVRGACYGGFGRVARFAEDERRKARDRGVPSLFAVAGDTFQGTPYFSFYKWKPVVEFVNQLRPDVMTLGNHEFDDGINSLVSYLDGIKTIPTVVCNLNTTAEPELDKFLLPSKVFMLNNTKVGIVGYLTTDTPTISKTGKVEFFDEVESLKKEIKKLRDSGVNIIIGLGHSGIEVDKIIAKEVEDIDLIVGGHSHTLLYSGTPPSIEYVYGPYPYYVTNSKNKSVPILQAYANTKYIGKVDLSFNSNGELISINGSPTLLNHDLQQDQAMLNVVDKWKPNVTEITNFTIGYTVVELTNNCYRKECNLGNLISDSFVYWNTLINHKINEYWTDAPIGIIQAGGIRTSIDETNHDGFITLGQLINVMPFMNTLVKVTINGSNLLEAFEHSVSDFKINIGGRNLLQVSGILVEFDIAKSVGQRVASMLVRCGNCRIPKYEPLVLNASYTIIMNNFLAEGGDNYNVFLKTTKKNQILEVEDYNATAVYMQHTSPITKGIEGRTNYFSSLQNNKTQETSGAPVMHEWNFLLLLITIYMFLISNI